MRGKEGNRTVRGPRRRGGSERNESTKKKRRFPFLRINETGGASKYGKRAGEGRDRLDATGFPCAPHCFHMIP